jgi:SAM-dependent methyltransferase
VPFDVSPQDFAALRAWPWAPDGLAAVRDHSRAKEVLRWLKPSHRKAHAEYRERRAAWVRDRNFEAYFRDEDRTIDRERWEYLKLRKAWYIMPFGWDHFAAPDVTAVLDLGCGDGDTTQRIAEWIAKRWSEGGKPHPLTIVGVDLGESRIRNARAHCTAPHPDIRFEFLAADATKGLPYAARHFDYAVCSGVFEILDDTSAAAFAKTLCDVTARGFHVEDLLDRYPGGFPREDLSDLFRPHGFEIRRRAVVLTEPFSLTSEPDPRRLWPVLRDQNLWVERV